MIAQRIQDGMNTCNDLYFVPNEEGHTIKNAFVEAGPGSMFPGNSRHAVGESSDVFTQYLQGLRYLSRKKQRRCISRELR